MGKRTKEQRLKEYKHKTKQELRKKQSQNRERFLNGEPIRLSTRLHMPTSEQYIKVFNPEIIQNKITKLKSLDLKEVSEADLHYAINDVISYKSVPDMNHSMVNMMSTYRNINKDDNLYRVRICGDNSFETMKEESDAWNPPQKFAKKGRVNNENESLLYVAENMETAIKEVKIKGNQCFWLIVYDIKKDIGVINIGEPSAHDSEYSSIHNIIAEFLRSEFTRNINEGEEYEYRISNRIAKFFYPYNIYNYDGWSYPSVADKGLSSLCLDPIKAKEKMDIKYVIHYVKINNEIRPDYKGYLNAESGLFEFEKIDN